MERNCVIMVARRSKVGLMAPGLACWWSSTLRLCCRPCAVGLVVLIFLLVNLLRSPVWGLGVAKAMAASWLSARRRLVGASLTAWAFLAGGDAAGDVFVGYVLVILVVMMRLSWLSSPWWLWWSR